MNEARLRQFFYDSLPFLLYGLLIAFFLHHSWMKWGDPIVDTGKWYVPAQLLSGKVLYRDEAWFYGPLVPYLNALFFRIGGVQIGSLVASGILSLLLTVYALDRLAREVLETLSAVLVVATFIAVCAFGFYVSPCNYNFIIPYSYDTTYGLAFALLGVLFFQRTKKSLGKFPRILAIFFLSMTLLTRVEIGLLVIVAIALPGIVRFAAGRVGDRTEISSLVVVVFISAGISVLIFLTFFGFLFGGETGVWKTVLEHLSHRGPFEGRLTGWNGIGDNLLVWLISGAIYTLFVFMFAGGGYAALRILGPAAFEKKPLEILLLALVPVGLTVGVFYSFFGYQAQYRCLPLLCLVLGIRAACRLYRGQDTQRESLVLTLSLFAFLMLLRIFFRVWPGHYGFTLLVPGLIVYYLFFIQWVPSLFPLTLVRYFVKCGFMFLSLLFILSYAKTSLNWYDKSTLEVSSSRGNLSFFPTEPYISSGQFLEYIEENTRPEDTLAVFPEGIGFNFLSDRTNPLIDYAYNPNDIMAEGASTRVTEELDRYRVDYVALLQRDTTEQGFSSFGKDYGSDIMGYILKNYELQKLFGSFPYTSNRFGIALFKRKVEGVVAFSR